MAALLDKLHGLQGVLEAAQFAESRRSRKSVAQDKAQQVQAVARLKRATRDITAPTGTLEAIVEAYSPMKIATLNPLEYRMQVDVTSRPRAEGSLRFELNDIRMTALRPSRPKWPKGGITGNVMGKLPDKKLCVSIVTTNIVNFNGTSNEEHSSTMVVYRNPDLQCEYYVFLDPLGEGGKVVLRDKDIYTAQVRTICPYNAASVAECMDTLPCTVSGNIFGLRNWTVFHLESMPGRRFDQIVLWNQDEVNYGSNDCIWNALHMANCVLSHKQIFSRLPESPLTLAPELSLLTPTFDKLSKLVAPRSDRPLEWYKRGGDAAIGCQLLLSNEHSRVGFNQKNAYELDTGGSFLYTCMTYNSDCYDEDSAEMMYFGHEVWLPRETADELLRAGGRVPSADQARLYHLRRESRAGLSALHQRPLARTAATPSPVKRGAKGISPSGTTAAPRARRV